METIFVFLRQYTKGHNGMAREFHFNYEEVNDAMQFWLGPLMPGVVVFNPDTVKTIANKNGECNGPW